MNTDEKPTNDEASARDASGVTPPEIEELIDLVDGVPPDDNSTEPEQGTDVEPKAEDDEELIELTDVFEEGPSEPKEESLEPEGEEGPEEEGPIGLTDEVVPEVDSVPEQEEGVEPDDLAEEPELAELTEFDIAIPEPEEDSLVENLGLELTEEGLEISEEEGSADEDLEDLSELESEEPSLDEGPEPSAEFAEEAPPSGGAPEPVGGALAQAVLEELSEEKLEEIITSIVRQTIEEKVARIIIEAAEAAIAREIEKLKQAL